MLSVIYCMCPVTTATAIIRTTRGMLMFNLRKRVSKLKMILDQVKENKMPIESYTWIHKKAVLSADRKTFLAGWLTKTIDSLSIQ
jgi:hypothetical protein